LRRKTATQTATQLKNFRFFWVLNGRLFAGLNRFFRGNETLSIPLQLLMETAMQNNSARLEEALRTMVKIVQKRQDGRRYVPIVLALEKALQSSKNDDNEYSRILEMAGVTAT